MGGEGQIGLLGNWSVSVVAACGACAKAGRVQHTGTICAQLHGLERAGHAAADSGVAWQHHTAGHSTGYKTSNTCYYTLKYYYISLYNHNVVYNCCHTLHCYYTILYNYVLL